MNTRTPALLIAAAFVLLNVGIVLSGCEAWTTARCYPNCRSEARASSSLVSFLYPSGDEPPAENSIPQLNLPVRVGLAFLPSKSSTGAVGLEASHREALLERIRQRFSDRKFVKDIVIVPDYYLTGVRGFEGLQGVQRLYNVDVMALASFDQVSYRDDNKWSLGYLTIVGAYVLKGTRHDVTTLMDLAVVDPASRSILLRAGGTDDRHGTTTLIDQGRESREASKQSFSIATDQLIEHFDAALVQFEADVRAGKANVRVANAGGGAGGGGGGGGSLDVAWIVLLAAALALRSMCSSRAAAAGSGVRQRFRSGR
jgi:rhombotail lipoprotein